MTSVYTAYDPNTGLVALTGEDPGSSMATAPRRDPERYLDYRILHDADSYPSARQLVRYVTLAGEPTETVGASFLSRRIRPHIVMRIVVFMASAQPRSCLAGPCGTRFEIVRRWLKGVGNFG